MPDNNALPVTVTVENARLPANYEAARLALAECERVDECAEWANRAEALASYARQAHDPALEGMARRIRARAYRRMGELLKQVDGRGGPRGENEGPLISARTRQEAAMQAGLSDHQRVTAVRIANIAEDRFNELIESPQPPGTTKLAEEGRQAHPQNLTRVRTLAAEEEPAARAKGPILGEWDRLASKSRHREERVLDLIVQLHQAATKADLTVVAATALDRRNSCCLPAIREVLPILSELNSRLAKAGAPTNGTKGSHLKLVPSQPPCGPN